MSQRLFEGKKVIIMAHIFFEKLENRRSTQSLYSGYSTPGSTVQALYAAPTNQAPTNQVATFYGVMQPSTSYTPSPSTGSFPWGGWGYGYASGYGYGYGFNPSGFGGSNLFNPLTLWNNPLSPYPYTSSWSSPFSNLWSGASNFLSPVWNILGGLFGLQPSPWIAYPGYPPGTYPGQIRPLYAAPVSQPQTYYGISQPISQPQPYYGVSQPTLQLYYGVNLPPAPSTSYSPPSSTVWALYGISASQSAPSFWATSYWE